MAKSNLGLEDFSKAQDYITKAIAIFLSDEKRNPKNIKFSEDTDLAAAYIIQGDIFFSQNNLQKAIDLYRKAQGIYVYLYRENISNVYHVSELYLKGAKAACKAKDLYHYQCFGKPQMREFGREHFNTIKMLEYCTSHNMNLQEKQ